MELSNEFEVRAPIDQAWAVLTDLERIAPCLPGAQLQEVEGEEYRGIVKIKVGPITAQYKGAAHFVEKDDAAHRAVLSASGRDTRGQGNASAAIVAELTEHGDHTHVSVVTDLTITGKVAQFGRGVIGDVSAKLLTQFVENLETTVLGDGQGDGDAAAETVAATPGEATEQSDERARTTEMLASEIKKVWQDDEGSGAPVEPVRVEREALPPRPDLLVPAADPTPDATPPAPESSAGADTVSTPSGPRRIDSAEVAPIDLLDTAGSPVLKRLVPVLGALAVLVLVAALRRRRRRRR